MGSNPKIIIITGPCGVGKTTIVDILANKILTEVIKGDLIRQRLFPDIDVITEHPEKLQIVKQSIFEQSKSIYQKGNSVIIDYVILGEQYISKFQNEFGEDLVFKVLFPSRNTIYERDENRACWTSGKSVIDELYDKYKVLFDVIGEQNYMDNEFETPEETSDKILRQIHKLAN